MRLSRFSHTFSALRASSVHVRGRAQTRNVPSGGCAGTGKTCTSSAFVARGLVRKRRGQRGGATGERIRQSNPILDNRAGFAYWRRRAQAAGVSSAIR
jgi:hypothetical protein